MTRRHQKHRHTSDAVGDPIPAKRGRLSPTAKDTQKDAHAFTIVHFYKIIQRLHYTRSGEYKESVAWTDVKKHYKKATGEQLGTEELNRLCHTQGLTRHQIIGGPLAGLLEMADAQGHTVCARTDIHKGSDHLNRAIIQGAIHNPAAGDAHDPASGDCPISIRSDDSNSPTVSTDPDSSEALSPVSSLSPSGVTEEDSGEEENSERREEKKLYLRPSSPTGTDYATCASSDTSFVTAVTSPSALSDWSETESSGMTTPTSAHAHSPIHHDEQEDADMTLAPAVHVEEREKGDEGASSDETIDVVGDGEEKMDEVHETEVQSVEMKQLVEERTEKKTVEEEVEEDTTVKRVEEEERQALKMELEEEEDKENVPLQRLSLNEEKEDAVEKREEKEVPVQRMDESEEEKKKGMEEVVKMKEEEEGEKGDIPVCASATSSEDLVTVIERTSCLQLEEQSMGQHDDLAKMEYHSSDVSVDSLESMATVIAATTVSQELAMGIRDDEIVKDPTMDSPTKSVGSAPMDIEENNEEVRVREFETFPGDETPKQTRKENEDTIRAITEFVSRGQQQLMEQEKEQKEIVEEEEEMDRSIDSMQHSEDTKSVASSVTEATTVLGVTVLEQKKEEEEKEKEEKAEDDKVSMESVLEEETPERKEEEERMKENGRNGHQKVVTEQPKPAKVPYNAVAPMSDEEDGHHQTQARSLALSRAAPVRKFPCCSVL